MKTQNSLPCFIKEELFNLDEIIPEMAGIRQKLYIKIKKYELLTQTCIGNVRAALRVDNEPEARYWLKKKFFYERELDKHNKLIIEFNAFTEEINEQLKTIY